MLQHGAKNSLALDLNPGPPAPLSAALPSVLSHHIKHLIVAKYARYSDPQNPLCLGYKWIL